ncbi:MAG: hypothetical protein QW470_06180 [Candidatus Caldarchaeum sp.]
MKPAYIHGRWVKVETEASLLSSSWTKATSRKHSRRRKYHRLQLRITEEMHRWLADKAAENKVSIAFFLRRLIRREMWREGLHA